MANRRRATCTHEEAWRMHHLWPCCKTKTSNLLSTKTIIWNIAAESHAASFTDVVSEASRFSRDRVASHNPNRFSIQSFYFPGLIAYQTQSNLLFNYVLKKYFVSIFVPKLMTGIAMYFFLALITATLHSHNVKSTKITFPNHWIYQNEANKKCKNPGNSHGKRWHLNPSSKKMGNLLRNKEKW